MATDVTQAPGFARRSCMLAPMASTLWNRVVDAYGGDARWRALLRIRVQVSANGVAYRMKWQTPIVEVPAEVAVWEPLVRFQPNKPDGLIEVFAGTEVRLEQPDGRVVQARVDPRRSFPGGRRLLWWDRLDQVYFAGYALWNYLTFPALLLREEIAWEETAASTLRAEFPKGFPTHSRIQHFHFDPTTALLVQHDYTAEVIGGWAKAAHCVLAHERTEGLPFGTRRRVLPRRRDGSPARFPTLVGIDLKAVALEESQSTP